MTQSFTYATNQTITFRDGSLNSDGQIRFKYRQNVFVKNVSLLLKKKGDLVCGGFDGNLWRAVSGSFNVKPRQECFMTECRE